jgi:hypothetical protein
VSAAVLYSGRENPPRVRCRKADERMTTETPSNGVSVALIGAGATIIASQQPAGWILVAVGVLWARRKLGE